MFLIDNQGTSATTKLVFKNAGSTAMLIDSSQNVGIGTTSPITKTHIKGDGLTVEEASAARKIQIIPPASGVDSKIRTHATSAGFIFQNNPSGDGSTFVDLVNITGSGNVGIGTTSPVSNLEIAKDDQTNGATLSITNSFDGGGWSAGDTVGTINFRASDPSTTEPIRGQVKVFDDAADGTNTYPFASAMSFSTA